MKSRIVRLGFLSYCLMNVLDSTASGAFVNVATWTQNLNTGGGPLLLAGILGSTSVTLQTAAVPPNAGLAGFEPWNMTPATSGFVTSQSPTSGNTWIAIAQGASTTEVLTFGSAVVNPILLIDFADPTVTYNFDGLSTTLLSSHNAVLAGNTLGFPGATDSDLDGAAVQVNGTFTTFSFVSSDSGGRTDTQRFTVATLASSVSEPTSLLLCGTGAVIGIARSCRRRCKVARPRSGKRPSSRWPSGGRDLSGAARPSGTAEAGHRPDLADRR